MKVTEKQLIILIRVLEGSLRIAGVDNKIFASSHQFREDLYNELLNAQEAQVKVQK